MSKVSACVNAAGRLLGIKQFVKFFESQKYDIKFEFKRLKRDVMIEEFLRSTYEEGKEAHLLREQGVSVKSRESSHAEADLTSADK